MKEGARFSQDVPHPSRRFYLMLGPNELKVTGGLMDSKAGLAQTHAQKSFADYSVIAAALDAARRSYSPYSTGESFNYAGLAVHLRTVQSTRDAAENAAYNPSLSPLPSALTFMNTSRPLAAMRALKRCVLVEVPTLASQRSVTQAALAACAPTVNLEYYTARLG